MPSSTLATRGSAAGRTKKGSKKGSKKASKAKKGSKKGSKAKKGSKKASKAKKSSKKSSKKRVRASPVVSRLEAPPSMGAAGPSADRMASDYLASQGFQSETLMGKAVGAYIQILQATWLEANADAYVQRLINLLAAEFKAMNEVSGIGNLQELPISPAAWKDIQSRAAQFQKRIERNTASITKQLGKATYDAFKVKGKGCAALQDVMGKIQYLLTNRAQVERALSKGEASKLGAGGSWIDGLGLTLLQSGTSSALNPQSAGFQLANTRPKVHETYQDIVNLQALVDATTRALNRTSVVAIQSAAAQGNDPYEQSSGASGAVDAIISGIADKFKLGTKGANQLIAAYRRWDGQVPTLEVLTIDPRNVIDLLSVPQGSAC